MPITDAKQRADDAMRLTDEEIDGAFDAEEALHRPGSMTLRDMWRLCARRIESLAQQRERERLRRMDGRDFLNWKRADAESDNGS